MIVAVADTHTALWHLLNDKRLSSAADSFLMEAANTGHKIALSSISLVEVVYLVDKGRIPASAYKELVRALADPEHLFIEAVLSAPVVESIRQVSRAEVPDMPDRIIAGTAAYLALPVISRDRHIRTSSLKTIW
jgi:PIN domain nuclease of toxin-antitoxin system